MAGYSQQRLEEKIIKAISLMIVQKEIKNSKISSLVSVSHVQLSSDNSYATVYITGINDDEYLKNSIIGLNESKSFIQSKLGSFLKTKNTPKLSFKKDESIEISEKMDKLFEEIKDERKNQP